MLDDGVFEVASTDPDHPLTEHKAKGVAEALRRQECFDEIRTEPRGGSQDLQHISSIAFLECQEFE